MASSLHVNSEMRWVWTFLDVFGWISGKLLNWINLWLSLTKRWMEYPTKKDPLKGFAVNIRYLCKHWLLLYDPNISNLTKIYYKNWTIPCYSPWVIKADVDHPPVPWLSRQRFMTRHREGESKSKYHVKLVIYLYWLVVWNICYFP